jgi:hypothetical protein
MRNGEDKGVQRACVAPSHFGLGNTPTRHSIFHVCATVGFHYNCRRLLGQVTGLARVHLFNELNLRNRAPLKQVGVGNQEPLGSPHQHVFRELGSEARVTLGRLQGPFSLVCLELELVVAEFCERRSRHIEQTYVV